VPLYRCDKAVAAAGNIEHDGGLPACFFCVKAFSETDLHLTEDLKAIDVQTLIIHGDDGQIVPIGASAMLSSKIVRGAKLKVYPGAPHGLATTHKDQLNAELLHSSAVELEIVRGAGCRVSTEPIRGILAEP
jgi:pimeloyl-ACP methyl ester carboxylesterase